MKYGFIKVAAAVPAVKVADVVYNVQQIESLIAQAEGQGVEVMVFPELSLTGYSCQDLFKEQLLIDKAEEGLMLLLDFTRKLDVISIVGLPVQIGDQGQTQRTRPRQTVKALFHSLTSLPTVYAMQYTTVPRTGEEAKICVPGNKASGRASKRRSCFRRGAVFCLQKVRGRCIV